MIKSDNNELTSLLAGISGEYFVAAELSRLGYIASITLRNTRGIDILASNQNANRTVAIQVKTNRTNKKVWMMTEKAEDFLGVNHFYVFVNLRDTKQRPDFHIVPCKEVAAFVSKNHKKWLQTPGVKGQKHNDNKMRMFEDKSSRYLEKWDLLGL